MIHVLYHCILPYVRELKAGCERAPTVAREGLVGVPCALQLAMLYPDTRLFFHTITDTTRHFSMCELDWLLLDIYRLPLL